MNKDQVIGRIVAISAAGAVALAGCGAGSSIITPVPEKIIEKSIMKSDLGGKCE